MHTTCAPFVYNPLKLYSPPRPLHIQQELYVRGNVCSHEAELVRLADSLRDGMHREVQLFSTLSLTRLMKPPGLR